jgi:hypothetical protein
MNANKDFAASKVSNTQSLAADQRAVAAAVTDPSRGLGNRKGEFDAWLASPTGCGPARTAAKLFNRFYVPIAERPSSTAPAVAADPFRVG